MTLRGLRQLATLIIVVVGLVALVAVIYWKLADVSEHRAFTLVFYLGGAILLLVALLTRGAENRGSGLGSGAGLTRRMYFAPEQRALNPTGALALTAVIVLVLGGVFDSIL